MNKLLAIMCLAVALTITGCGQASADSTYEKEIEELESENEELESENEELESENEELKKEIEELKAQLSDIENNQPEQLEETSELDGFVAETSGVCGADLKWEYGNGILRISGTGEMADFDCENYKAPWYDISDKIIQAYVGGGCTHIGEAAFYGMNSLSKIVFSDEGDNCLYGFSDGSGRMHYETIDGKTGEEDEGSYLKRVLPHYASLKVIVLGDKEYTPEEFVERMLE